MKSLVNNPLAEVAGHAVGGPRSDAGFTLVEVLLSVVILTLGLTVLLTCASRCMAVMREARDFQVAQCTMGMGDAQFPPAESDNMEQDLVVAPTEVNGQTFSREVTVEGDIEKGKKRLLIVRNIVTWTTGYRQRKEEVVRYVLDAKP